MVKKFYLKKVFNKISSSIGCLIIILIISIPGKLFAQSSDATLSNLTINPGSIVFDGSQSYSANVPAGTTNLVVTPTLNDATATFSVSWPGGSGDGSNVPLVYPNNPITVTVTAQDLSTKLVYTINVNVQPSTDATLSNLTSSSGSLNPVFAAGTIGYTISVPNGTASIALTPTVNNQYATVKVNGTLLASGSASSAISLTAGVPLAIPVLVTAQDGSTNTYTVTVTRAKSSDANLSNLTISPGSLAFSPSTTNYTGITVPSGTTTLVVTPTVEDATATAVVSWPGGYGNGSNVPLVYGSNAITVTVTAQDGTVMNYNLNVTVQASSDATLSNLALSSGSISFNKYTTLYSISVPNSTTSIALTPTTSNSFASVIINGTTVPSGSASALIGLSPGVAQTIPVNVTAQNGNTNTYTVIVTRAKSSDANLSNLTISPGSITFATATTTYTGITVPSGTTTLVVTPTVEDATATAIITSSAGAVVGSNAPLALGANTITIAVTAQDGTVLNYTLNVTVPPSTDATLSNLTSSSGSLNPVFAAGTIGYTISVPNATTSIALTPMVNNQYATVKVNGTLLASGSASSAINLTAGVPLAIPVLVTAQDGSTNTYTVTVTRAKSSDANLSNLTISPGSITFATATTTYTGITVPSGTTTLVVTPTVEDATATAVITSSAGAVVGSNAPLALGANTITIAVTAQDGTVLNYTLSVTVPPSTDATLSNLTTSSGSLNPVFAAGTIGYTISVPNATTSIALTPTVNNQYATVKVNGTLLASGSASSAISLTAGVPLAIPVLVTAQDGSTNTYTVTVTRAKSSDANLSNLTISPGSITFATATTTYTGITVPVGTTTLVVTPTVEDATATTVITSSAGAVVGSNAPLALGANTITIAVTAQDGTVLNYTLSVNVPKSTDATLSNLASSSGSLNPVFAAGTIGYTISVPNATNSIALTPTVNNQYATVKVNGTLVASGSASSAISLTAGVPLAIPVLVTAQDGSTNTYTVTVTRAKSSDANLSNLTISPGSITFTTATTTYTGITVPVGTTTLVVTPTVEDATATAVVTSSAGAVVGSNAPLALGANTITIAVTAQDGTVLNYTLNVTVPPSTDATLSNLASSSGSLNPVFAAGTIGYTISVPNVTTSIALTPTVHNQYATVKVNGTLLASGSASSAIGLTAGVPLAIPVLVTAQDGSTNTYTVTVTRAKSSDANLSNLTISPGSITFATATTTYTGITVPSGTTTLVVTPTVEDATATTVITSSAGAVVGSNAPLALGANTITIAVTAQDGTVLNYTLSVTVPPSTDAKLSNLALSSGSITFDKNTTIYNVSVSNATTSVTITPTVNNQYATVKVNGTLVASGSASAAISLSPGVAVPITVLVTAQDGSTTQTYTVNVTQSASAVATLSNLNVSSGSLSPIFNAGTTNYTVNVSNSTSTISVGATSNNNATITVNGVPLASGSNTAPIALGFAPNTILVKVTSQDLSTNLTYNITVIRAQSSEAHLNALTLNNGTLSPTFTQNTLNYTVNVANNVNSITVTPTAVDNVNASISISGIIIPSGTASLPQALNVGINNIQIDVQAQDNTTLHYVIAVTRAASSDASLNTTTNPPKINNGAYALTSVGANYTASVPTSISSITVSAAANDPNATVTINGNANQTTPIPLSVGSNTISIKIVAQDGIANSTTTITVTRLASTDATLSNLTTSNGTLSPTFSSGVTSYNVNVGNAINTINVTPTLNDLSATVKVNGNNVISGQSLNGIILNVGSNTITTVVTAQDGSTTQTYTLTVTRAGSNNSSLSAFTISAGTLSPVFSSGTSNYTASVAGNTQSISITPTADPTATIKVNGATVLSGNSSGPISLNLGANTITTVVTAQDGVSTSTYILTVNRVASTDANLSNLGIDNGTLSPTFTSGNLSYTVNGITNANSTIVITPTTNDPNATVRVNGTNVLSGNPSSPVVLNVGTNVISVLVTAQDGTTKQPYSLTVIRLPSTDVTLSSLTLSSGTLNPPFTVGQTTYSATVANTVSSITVTASTTVSNSILRINGTTVPSGTPSAPISLFSGYNTITVSVTSQDGTNTLSRTISVYKTPSTDATLNGLTFSGGSISPGFSSGVKAYTATVSYATSSVTVTPTSNDPNASINLNGNGVLSGVPSSPILLNVGPNIITFYVLADDGTTNLTYTLTITRAGSNDAALSNLTTTAGSLSPTFAPATSNYTVTVANNVPNITVTPTAHDANATIQVNGIKTNTGNPSSVINLNVGLNNIVVKVTAQDGSTVLTYNIGVTRSPSSDASLSNLAIDNGVLSPSFSSTSYSYTDSVANTVSTLNITPTTNDNNATVRVNGNIVISGSPSSVSLNVGSNAINIVVTAQDGTLLPYNLTVIRAQSSIATLSNLVLNNGAVIVPISPAFDSATLSYNANVDNTVTSITIKPISTDPNAIIKVNGIRLLSGSTSQSIVLNSGNNVIPVTVQSQDHKANQAYSITINKASSSDAILSDLQLSSGSLSPTFNSNTYIYNASVPNTTNSISITPVPHDVNAVITFTANGNTTTFQTGTPFQYNLNTGDNNLVLTIKSADGSQSFTYNLDVYRLKSSLATLSNLTSSDASPITPGVFSSSTLNYTQNVPFSSTTIKVTPTATDVNSTITVNGITTTSGNPSQAIALAVGVNNINVLVTSQDGQFTQTYTLAVTRAGSPDASLANLIINAGGLPALNQNSPITSPINLTLSTNSYTLITINPTTTNANATVTVNGITVPYKGTSAAIPVSIGNNIINLVVTAQDGVTTQAYTINVTRPPGTDATLSNLTTSTGTLSPVFNSSVYDYNFSVLNSTKTIAITPTANDPDADITVNGSGVLTGVASSNINLNVGLNTITTVVTASDGNTTQRYTIRVTRLPATDASLSNITLSNGTLSPIFASGTLAYTANVANSISTISVTPTLNDANATVKVNGTIVQSMSASGQIPLNVGANTIYVIGTAQDGNTTQTYTLTVNRDQSSDATLTALTSSDGTIKPNFDSNKLNYTDSVLNSTSSITIIPTTNEGNATIKVNGMSVTSGTSQTIPLVVGPNVITTLVTAQNGSSQLQYTLTVTRAPSGINTLSGLAVNGGGNTYNLTESPAGVFSLSDLPNTVSSITITPTTTDGNATVKVNGLSQLSGVASNPITVNVGDNNVVVAVAAQDLTVKQYTVNIHRDKSTISTLSNLTINNGQNLSPVFDPLTKNYTVSVLNNIDKIAITPFLTDNSASVSVNGVITSNGTASGDILLNVGTNIITVVGVAQAGGIDTSNYSIKITRAPSSIVTLQNLTLSAGNLLPTPFDPLRTFYTDTVSNATSNVTITPTPSDPNATITINGNPVASGVGYNINLSVGDNTLVTIVVAQDGVATKTYTVKVVRKASSVADISTLVVTDGTNNVTLTPAFSSSGIAYTASVGNGTQSVKVTATTTDPNAVMNLNGQLLTSSIPSWDIPLNVGANTITDIVTAQDGVTMNTYTINITRAGSADAALTNIGLSTGNLTPSFNAGTTSYTVKVDNSVTAISLTPFLNDNNAVVSVNGNTIPSGSASSQISLNVGDNNILVNTIAQDGSHKLLYTVTVNRAFSSNALLNNLVTDYGNIVAFSPQTNSYTTTVANSISAINVTATIADASSTLKINGNLITLSGNVGTGIVPLNIGVNNINILVNAQDGTPNTYTLTVTRAAGTDATMSNILVSAGTLTPTFTSGNTNYTVEVPFTTTSITVTPTTNDGNATVNVNAVSVASGKPSNPIPLAVDANTITVTGTAQDLVTNVNYTITVNRDEGSTNTSLNNLTPSVGTLSPTFSTSVKSYTINLPFENTNITLTPTLADNTATLYYLLNSNGTATPNFALNSGKNEIDVIVTAQNGKDTSIYAVIVNRIPSAINSLSNLTLNSGTLSPTFSTDVKSYTVNLPLETTSISLTPTLTDSRASLYYKLNSNGTATPTFALNQGRNEIDVIVTAQNGIDTSIYAVIVNRIPSTISTLSGITLTNTSNNAPVKINENFDGTNVFNYTAFASNSTTSITVTPSLTDLKGSVTVNGTKVTSGTASGAIPLIVGDNIITVISTAQDGITTSSYTITVTRGKSGDATLSGITIDGALITGFSPSTTSYVQTVANSSTTVAISASTNNDAATYSVNGVALNPGDAIPIDLNLNKNIVTIVVTAQDKVTTITYNLEIDRPTESQVFTFPQIAAKTYGAEPFDPGAIVTSGLQITYTSSDTSVADIDTVRSQIIVKSPGKTTITASVKNNSSYATITPISQVLTVLKANQTITGFTYPKIKKDTTYSLENVKTTALGYQVYFTSSDTNIVKVVKYRPANETDTSVYTTYLKAVELGEVTITAYQPGNKYYNAAPSLALTINVNDPGGPDLVVHQALTPNGDGVNDYFNVEGITNFTDNTVTIVNPNGIKVYYEKNYDNGAKRFDGHSNITGQFLPSGTYFYLIKYSNGSTSKQVTGYLVIKY